MGVESKIWERSYPKHCCITDKPETMKILPQHFSVNCFPHGGLSGAVMSGPDGLSEYRAPVPLDKRPIANYQFTSEGSYDADYVWRLQPCLVSGKTPVHLRPRSAFAGEIGWHATVCRDRDPPRTGHQILMSEFWTQSNDRGSHRHQDVWYPGLGQAGKPEQSYYFERFPYTGQVRRRAYTACPTRSRRVASSVTSETTMSQLPPAPPASKTTDDDVYIISVESSEDVGRSTEQGGNQPKNGRLLKSRHSCATTTEKRVPEDTSSSSYTTYTRLPTPPSSHTHQP